MRTVAGGRGVVGWYEEEENQSKSILGKICVYYIVFDIFIRSDRITMG